VERLPQLVAELTAAKVDLIFTSGFPAALAAKKGTTLPVVAINAGDPVGTGLVASLARPGGNLTGISDVSAEVTPKRLELLKEITPQLRRVAMLWNADDLGMTLRYRASETGAQELWASVCSRLACASQTTSIRRSRRWFASCRTRFSWSPTR
jgi:putative ABC transport system substrate-binding protein